MDKLFVIPIALRPVTIQSLHYGQPGRDTMLANSLKCFVAEIGQRGGNAMPRGRLKHKTCNESMTNK